MIILYTDSVSIHMIDFGKTVRHETQLSHDAEWTLGNHEDGYLIGIRNLQSILAKVKN